MYQALGRGMSSYYSILPSISNPDNLEGMHSKVSVFVDISRVRRRLVERYLYLMYDIKLENYERIYQSYDNSTLGKSY